MWKGLYIFIFIGFEIIDKIKESFQWNIVALMNLCYHFTNLGWKKGFLIIFISFLYFLNRNSDICPKQLQILLKSSLINKIFPTLFFIIKDKRDSGLFVI